MLYRNKYSYFFLIRLSAKERKEYLQKLFQIVSDSSEFSNSGDEDYVSQNLRKYDPNEFSDNEFYGMFKFYNKKNRNKYTYKINYYKIVKFRYADFQNLDKNFVKL